MLMKGLRIPYKSSVFFFFFLFLSFSLFLSFFFLFLSPSISFLYSLSSPFSLAHSNPTPIYADNFYFIIYFFLRIYVLLQLMLVDTFNT